MDYFGAPYPKADPAPIYVGATHVPTPVGQACIYCGKSILAGDNGFMIPFQGKDVALTIEPWHRLCFLESTFGPELLKIVREQGEEEFGESIY